MDGAGGPAPVPNRPMNRRNCMYSKHTAPTSGAARAAGRVRTLGSARRRDGPEPQSMPRLPRGRVGSAGQSVPLTISAPSS